MNSDEALALLDQILPNPLNNLQETIFCQVWAEKTYAAIADEYDYEHSYIRDVGFKLWQLLSEILNEKVSKSNVKIVLTRYATNYKTSQTSTTDSEGPHLSPTTPKQIVCQVTFPHGPVPVYSEFYIERPPIESRTSAEILKPGSLIRLKGPRQVGKTSLLKRILHHAEAHGIRVLNLSLHRADSAVFESSDRFLRWFCASLSYQLGIPSRLEDYWNLDIGSKLSCTLYLEEHILKTLKSPIVIALDEVNKLFQFPDVSSDFLPLLRSWYEDSKEIEIWQHLRWILSHATDIYVPLQLTQSPFNVGLSVSLPDFTLEQVQTLAERYGLSEFTGNAGMRQLMPLLRSISCRPGLVRLAFYHLSQTSVDVDTLIATAHTQSGIYSDHLRHLLAAIQPHTDLQVALKGVIYSDGPVKLPPILAYRLESIGLIKVQGNSVSMSCGIYRQFFADYFIENPNVFLAVR